MPYCFYKAELRKLNEQVGLTHAPLENHQFHSLLCKYVAKNERENDSVEEFLTVEDGDGVGMITVVLLGRGVEKVVIDPDITGIDFFWMPIEPESLPGTSFGSPYYQ
jgi:hypothetical protein